MVPSTLGLSRKWAKDDRLHLTPPLPQPSSFIALLTPTYPPGQQVSPESSCAPPCRSTVLGQGASMVSDRPAALEDTVTFPASTGCLLLGCCLLLCSKPCHLTQRWNEVKQAGPRPLPDPQGCLLQGVLSFLLACPSGPFVLAQGGCWQGCGVRATQLSLGKHPGEMSLYGLRLMYISQLDRLSACFIRGQ